MKSLPLVKEYEWQGFANVHHFLHDKSTSKKEKAPITGAPDFINAFPPSRRSILPDLAKTLPSASAKKLLAVEPSGNFLVKDALPTTQTYSLDNEVPKYTPTGFSTAEINAMGDFPAYDILSGVPLPQAYENFDASKALPRPYRPLRWKYHQTMCKSLETPSRSHHTH